MPPSAAALAAHRLVMMKKKNRSNKKASVARSRVTAMPRIPKVILDANYVNPVTLEFPKNMVVYEIKNRTTGRTNYYNKVTFRKLITAFKNDYNLLMKNPKVPIPGAKNPMTRGPIYPRNIRRVAVKAKAKTPSPNTAAKRIQNAVRKRKARSK
jgi:hypothetical protein